MASRALTGVCLVALLAAAGPAAAQGATSAQGPAPTTPQPTTAPPTTAPTTPAARPPEPTREGPVRPGRSRRQSKRVPRQARPAQDRGGMAARQSRAAGPVTQALLVDVNLVGGYDDNLSGGGTGAVDPTTMASGTVGTLDTGIAYRAGNTRHALTFDSRGIAYVYPDYLDGPALGATATVGGKVTVLRNTAVDGSQTVGYEPFFSTFSPDASAVAPTVPVAQAIPVTGLFERRSIISRSAVSVTQLWGRASTTAGYAYGVRRFRGDDVIAGDAATGDNASQVANAGFRVSVSNAVDVRADYQYTSLEFTDTLGALRPNRAHRIEGGASVEKATRRGLLSLTATAGASRLESTPFLAVEQASTWVPTATVSVKVPLNRAWVLDGGYRRDFALLQGLANDLYANDEATLGVGGLLARRTTLELGTSAAVWRTPLPGTADSTARIYGGSIRLVQMVTDTIGLMASYNYYRHRFSAGSGLPPGFPAAYDRNAVRVGITLRFPVKGPQGAAAAGGR